MNHRFVTTMGLACFTLVACGGGQESAPPPAAPTASVTGASASSAPAATPSVPDSLKVAADQSVLLKTAAKGVQIYSCKAKADAPTTFEWSLKAPEADLMDESGKKVGSHYAGPTWELSDGSKVVATKKAQADAPEAGAVPWLLLDSKTNEGSGTLSHVKSIQRIGTSGGKAPADGCDAAHANAEVRVPYTATYYFYGVR